MKVLPPKQSKEVWIKPSYAIVRFMESKLAFKTRQDQSMLFTAKVVLEENLPLQMQLHLRFDGRDEWFDKADTLDLDVYIPLNEMRKCKEMMDMDLKDFVKEKEFGTSTDRKTESFPEGTTKITVSKTDVAELQVKFDEGEKTRYVLKVGGKEYWAGNQIMDGIKAATEAGFDSVAITRKGQGIHTKYTVMGVPDEKKDEKEQATL